MTIEDNFFLTVIVIIGYIAMIHVFLLGAAKVGNKLGFAEAIFFVIDKIIQFFKRKDRS
ncbi:MAG: hypothetical protein H7X86_03105 [Gorillibacterium sp.]|nr:hypothetical protein [Gorillibacterium sp.]